MPNPSLLHFVDQTKKTGRFFVHQTNLLRKLHGLFPVSHLENLFNISLNALLWKHQRRKDATVVGKSKIETMGCHQKGNGSTSIPWKLVNKNWKRKGKTIDWIASYEAIESLTQTGKTSCSFIKAIHASCEEIDIWFWRSGVLFW